MSYKIVVDSCCELPEGFREMKNIEFIPLGLEVGDYHIMDDENFNQTEFLKKVAACPTCPKSSCPSPERYQNAYETGEDDVYVVTLSDRLSGSHNSAVLGKNLSLEKKGNRNIHVVDSKSASCGEAQIALEARDLGEAGIPFKEVVERLEIFRDELKTYFVLDNLETLRKNGRMSSVKALVASTLSIKPVMAASMEGEIMQLGQAIGIKKALKKMVDYILKDLKDSEKKRLIISQCNARERAEYIKNLLEEKAHFKEVIILETAGISSMYANNGGIIVAV